MLRAIIIDDEPECVRGLSILLERHCPQVAVVHSTNKPEDGLLAIQKYAPHIVFLDVEMPKMNGFQLLESIGDINFSVVFTTAYDKFAVRAFKYSAIDYLLKPIDQDELIKAVAKAEHRIIIEKNQLEMLRQSLYAPHKMEKKIALPNQNGYVLIEIEQILYCESDNTYTKIYLTTGENYLICRTLGDVEETLTQHEFFRVHKQFLVNLKHISQYSRSDGGFLMMKGGKQIPVSRNRKDSFGLLLMKI